MRKRREPSPVSPRPPGELPLALEVAEFIAHEINNLLNTILLNAAVLERKTPDRGRAELATIREAGTRAGVIIHRWQQLNPRRPAALEATDLNRLVREVVASWLPPRPNLRVQFDPAADLPPVLAEPQEIKRLVGLLLNHAAAAMSSGTLQVRTQLSEGEVLLTVEDGGAGIEPALLDRVFEPFFAARTLPAADELNSEQDLGLALCKKLVRRQQGSIHAENRPEGGVRVVIRFRKA